MSFVARDYSGISDLVALRGLAGAAAEERGPSMSVWQPGDVTWNVVTRVLRADLAGPSDRIRLWWDGAEAVAGAALLGGGEAYLEVRPGIASKPTIADVTRWAEDGVGASVRAIHVSSIASDASRRALFEGLGYAPQGDATGNPRLRFDLSTPISESVVPRGMRFRDCVDVDLDERSAAHRDAWEHLEHIGIVGARSSLTTEAYAQLRAAPGYEPTLDFAIEDDDGTIVASCICWADEVTGLGLFEPVGTRSAFRGRGLARALILGGLERLRERGLRTALVGTARINEPALRLYEGCGFAVTDYELTFEKRLAG